ncbi:peptidylprolyl isomerase [Brevundimonas sp. 2R-24]|uniref:peptidylprolyl isomerase n=1 Tax=Peiella sedimenti TaxID=3061083 RepID=A0ABT8SKN2_9CAUL|nr:peptidylprolyl isomerase [Caulobacteraceae bacterium XZ-24]
MRRLIAGIAAAVALGAAGPGLTQDGWRTPDPQNLLVIDTTKGRIVVEMVPEAAPQHVARLRELAGRGFYDGLIFHRVIDTFMAQTGDPQGTGAGGSDLPDLPAEFTFRRGDAVPFQPVPDSLPNVRAPLQAGLWGVLPVVTQPDGQMMATLDGKAGGEARFCPGVAAMARTGGDVNSANSQFFLMRQMSTNLNSQYTVWGRVLTGLDVVRGLNVGEPPASPDRMTRVRAGDQMPEAERPRLRVAEANSPQMAEAITAVRAQRGARFNLCDIQPVVEAG